MPSRDKAIEQQTDFYLEKLSPLIGGKITGLARTGVDEFGVECFGLCVKLTNGKTAVLILLSDDEGNDRGSFELQTN